MSDRELYKQSSVHQGWTPPSASASPKAAAQEVQRRTVEEELDYYKKHAKLSASGKELIYNSYAGSDIVAEVVIPGEGPMTLGELQTISYSIHRENNPVRLLGHTNPTGFVKGPRTIAGSLIFTVFNYYAFYRLQQFQHAITNNLYPLADMLPPFDVVLTFANEGGVFSKMKIYGISIVDEGGTMSIDDLITEQTYQYMARGIQPMTGYYLEG